MATTNQQNRSGNQKNSQGAKRGESTEKREPADKQATDSQKSRKSDAPDERHKLADMREQMANYVSQGTEQFGQMTRGHEGQATLIALAAGFGVGLIIGCSLATGHRKPQTWSERLVSDGFGRKFMDRVERMLPEAISEHFGR